MSDTVCVLSQTGRDAELILQLLHSYGIASERYPDMPALLRQLQETIVGPVLLAEEMLTPAVVSRLSAFVEAQPSWSDLPMLVLTGNGRDTPETRRLEALRGSLGNPILLERPIRTATLLSSVRAALRARQRQYQVRDALLERDRAFAELRAERELLRVTLESLPVGVVVADRNGGILTGNSAAERIFGHAVLTTEGIEGYRDYVGFHADGRRFEAEEYPLARAIRTGQSVPAEEILYRRGDGSYRWISIAATPTRDEAEVISGGVVAIVDIDETKRFADGLRASEERFRRLVENASVGVSISDFNGNISYMNPSLLRTLGYTEDDLRLGRLSTAQLTSPEYAELEANALERLRLTGIAAPFRKSYRARDGRAIPFLVGAIVLGSQRGGDLDPEIASFFTDLSSQQRAEVALIQSEKLAAVGRLAASISHEINNPLEAVTNLLYLIGVEPLTDTARDYLGSANRELARVSQIAAQTLRFHRQATGPRAVTARELLDSVIGLYSGRLHNSGIELRLDLRIDRPVLCLEGDIRQVLNNLVGNAIDAMRTGGRLIIRASAAHHWSTGRAGLRITVGDTGHGMPSATVRRIFEAFYTTKGINGTGLGLWISEGIVRKHAGYLQVRSRTIPGHSGTVFSLFLPWLSDDLDLSA